MPIAFWAFLSLGPYLAIGTLFARLRVKTFWGQAKSGIDDAEECEWTSCNSNRDHVWHRSMANVFLWLPFMPFLIISFFIGLVSDILDKEITKHDPFRAERELREAESYWKKSADDLQSLIESAERQKTKGQLKVQKYEYKYLNDD